ncbi:transglycosylase domain-containing protein [Dermabacteraceae bacterium P7074]
MSDGSTPKGRSRTKGRRRAATPVAAARPGRARKAAGKKNLLNYPRAGKTNPWRWLPSLRLLVVGACVSVLAMLGLFALAYSLTKVPEPNQVALAQTTTVYFSDGKTQMGTFSDVNRTIIPENEIPQNIKDAVVASEDSTFYENRGISPKGIVRALINNLTGGARQGGSTLTQQYVENYYLGRTTGYLGKIKEALMALKADEQLSKDQILSRYLNTIYFGRGAYGVQQAAKEFFGKDAKDLTNSEAAMLVAIIPAPSAYDPAKNPKKAQQLWDRVVKRQVEVTKTLTAQQAAEMKFPEVKERVRKNRLGGTNGYLLSMVRSAMVKHGIDADKIDTGGYKIITTIDVNVQKNTVEAVAKLPKGRPENNRVGTMTLDPRSGAIRAAYGGPDYIKQQRNDATQARMQAGSIFKTFTLIAALRDGVSLGSQWPGNTPFVYRDWTVKNFGNANYGNRIDLVSATAHSSNTAFAALNIDIGAGKTKETAELLGLTDVPGLDSVPSNVLGSASPTVKQMAQAYGAIASGGVFHEAYILEKVTDPSGEVVYEHKDNGKRVLDEAVAANATVALQGPTGRGGTARQVGSSMDRPVAGKTGTAEKFRAAWFVGYTPQLVTAVGMFQPSADGKVEEVLTPFGGERYITGGSFPAEIFVNIMKPSLKGEKVIPFPKRVYTKAEKKERESTPTRPAPRPAPEQPSEQPAPEQPSEQPQPEQPSEKPEEPEKPKESEKPEEPEKPKESEEPEKPKESEKPKDPQKPKESEKPKQSGGKKDSANKEKSRQQRSGKEN